MNTSTNEGIKKMNIGMLARGTRGQWNEMIEAAYAAKMHQVTQKNTKAQPAATRGPTASKSQAVLNRNLATLKEIRADILADALKA